MVRISFLFTAAALLAAPAAATAPTIGSGATLAVNIGQAGVINAGAGIDGIYVTSTGISNFTGDRSLSSGGKEMLIRTLEQMTARSHAVRFVAYGSDIKDVLDLQGVHPSNKTFRAPDYFIRGGATQFNKSAWAGQAGAGASFELSQSDDDNDNDSDGDVDYDDFINEFFDTDSLTTSFSRRKGLGSISMDLSAGFVANLQIVPGVYSANTLALRDQNGLTITGDLSLGELGLSYSYTNNLTRDFNDLMRALIQVGMIELIGKLHAVPYWRCLANAGSSEARLQALTRAWLHLESRGPAEVLRFAQQALAEAGYYEGPVDGTESAAFMDALQQYQRRMNLLATGVMSFQTFRTMSLYTPAREPSEITWWDQALPTGPHTPAPAGLVSRIAVPVSR